MDPINSYKWINTQFSDMKKTQLQQVRNYEVEKFTEGQLLLVKVCFRRAFVLNHVSFCPHP